MSERAIFVAGASGAVGRALVQEGLSAGAPLRPHYRKLPEGGLPHGGVVGSLDDHDWLTEQLRGMTTVLQLIGTMKKRFAAGDTYETSDVGTTRSLVECAKRAGTVDHLVLLSSVGAGHAVGAYLKAKARAESLVTASGLSWTTLRPGAFDGGGHHAPPGLGLLAKLPGLHSMRPIHVDELARTLLHIAITRAPLDTVLEGDAIFGVLGASR
ncbi:MAG: NAD(P)H-binding protein [Polyangia bacterium]